MSSSERGDAHRPADRVRELGLLLVGIDHRSAPLDLRERVAYLGSDAEDLLLHLLAEPPLAEALLLSTCNRTEVYVRAHDQEKAYRTVLDLAFRRRAPEIEEQGRFFVARATDAARHLLAVASGIESMVVGEPEILGQVRQAASLAESVGTSGPVLRRLARAAMAAGKRARAETAIGQGAVSLGYAVVELARNIFTHLEEQSALFVGAGETATLVARSLAEKGIGGLVVANRGEARRARFCEEFPGARPLEFAARLDALAEADLVVASTSAPEPVLAAEHVQAAMRKRPLRPLLVLDLGVPRNVDPEAGRVENVFLQNIDSLRGLIERNLRRRREEVPRVETILDDELAAFQTWHRTLAAEPVIASLQRRAEEIRQRELAAARDRFPLETHEHLDRLTRSLVRKILHHPSARLRSGNGEEIAELDLVRELFQLDEDG